MKKSNVKVVGSEATANMAASDAANRNNAIQVMVFENPEFGRIRTVTDENGEPLFCGKDVCDILGYKRTDLAVRQHVSQHDAAKRCVISQFESAVSDKAVQRNVKMLFVTESGFYSLVFGSKLPIAQRFKLWVTSVVLPQIRKTGGYIPLHEGDTEEDIRRRAEEVLRATLEQKDSCIAQQKKLIGEQEAEIDRLLPKALYADNVLDSISCFTTTQIAKELGLTAQELNRWLCANRVQYYQSGQYMLYAEFAHRGLAKSRTRFELNVGLDRVCTHTYLVWTERGRKFIHQMMEGMKCAVNQ